jgi:hypothetical protein
VLIEELEILVEEVEKNKCYYLEWRIINSCGGSKEE